MNSEYTPKTIIELESWMKDNCYTFDSYSVNGNIILEGYGIDNWGGLFQWYYTERGEKSTLKYFQTEVEIVSYAFEQIRTDRYANAHCIGFTTNKDEKLELENILIERELDFFQDEIPYYGLKWPTYRTFVLGCDVHKTVDLRQKYYKKK